MYLPGWVAYSREHAFFTVKGDDKICECVPYSEHGEDNISVNVPYTEHHGF